MQIELKYKRVLLKLSGEVLAGTESLGLEPQALSNYAQQVAELVRWGVEVGVVLGGGNFWRGRMAPHMGRDEGDAMGMLATVMNGLAFADALRRLGQEAVVMSAIPIPSIVEGFQAAKARQLLAQGKVLIFVGGTSNPYFTTDSAAALRGLQIGAQVVLKGTLTDGVYDSDPFKNPQAQRFQHLTFSEALRRDLRVMDGAAFSLCRDNNLPVYVFKVTEPGNLRQVVVEGREIGTLVKEEL